MLATYARQRGSRIREIRAPNSSDLPTMKGRVTFFDRNENSAAGRTDFSISAQRSVDCCAIVGKIDNVRCQ